MTRTLGRSTPPKTAAGRGGMLRRGRSRAGDKATAKETPRGRSSGPSRQGLKLTIALIAPPWYPLPPHGYGGIELVVSLLARGLRERGHHVVAFGAEDSHDGVIGLAPRSWREELGGPHTSLRELAYTGRVYRMLRQLEGTLGKLDLIHEHSGMAGILAAQEAGLAPVLHTVHGPLDEPQRTAYESLVDRARLVAISQSQRDSAPELPWVGTVHNAVDVDALRIGARDQKEPYLLVLARVCADKGQHLAIEVARRTGMKLVLAGKVEATPAGLDYYDRQIEPAVDGHQVVHLPNVAGQEKADLLARATALLAPITWPEPFGLSTVEAMVSGTPVISLHHGAAPELIDDGETGFVVGNIDEMVEAVSAVSEIDPARCAELARRRFSPDAMVHRYLKVYERAVSGEVDASHPAESEVAATLA